MKKIPLTQGKFALVDACDYHYLMQWKWCAHKNRQTYYAERNSPPVNGKRFSIRMHRIIANQLGFKLVDHINGNGLDNRRANLRQATLLENSRNKGLRKDNTSGYKGVHYLRRNKKWQARIMVDNKRLSLGLFLTKIEAALAYNKAAKKYFGKFARLNVA